MPKISVVVPVFKVEPYLHRCIDSILAQTFTDFELILVDDGSPDNCGIICDEYATMDYRIHVIHQSNGGLSAARNAGIDWAFENSDSEWLAFIDSDDWVHQQYFELLLQTSIKTNTSICACQFEKVFDSEFYNTKENILPKIRVYTPEYFWCNNCVVATVAYGKIYKKSSFSFLRYPYRRIHEDEYITYQIVFKEKLIAFIENKLYFYYQNPKGIMNSKWNVNHLDKLEAFRNQYYYYKANGYIHASRDALTRYKDAVAFENHNLETFLNGKNECKSVRKQFIKNSSLLA